MRPKPGVFTRSQEVPTSFLTSAPDWPATPQ